MKRTAFCCVILLLSALLVLSGCSGTPVKEPSPVSVTPTASPDVEPTEPTETADPLPDVDINSWEFLIANLYTYVGRYNPPCTAYESQMLDERIADQTFAMVRAASEAGYTLYNSASFRSFDYYENHYNQKVSELGSALEALKVCFPGGCSDHNTGLAIDFTDDKFYSADYEHTPDPDFQDTEAYQWLLDNCQDYGFIHRYPEGKEEYYGLACCPGHFRYVGVEAAKYIKEHDLCLEEFVALYK